MTNVLAGITKADIERAAKAIARMIPTESGHWNIGHGEDFPTQYSVAEQRLIRAIVATTLTAALAGRAVVPVADLCRVLAIAARNESAPEIDLISAALADSTP
jgi:hypothetical protein